jgi:hypothetical protein
LISKAEKTASVQTCRPRRDRLTFVEIDTEPGYKKEEVAAFLGGAIESFAANLCRWGVDRTPSVCLL